MASRRRCPCLRARSIGRAMQRASQRLRIGADPVRRLREGLTDRLRDLLACRVAPQAVAVLDETPYHLLELSLRLLRLTTRALLLRRRGAGRGLPQGGEQLVAQLPERALGLRLRGERGEPAGERAERRPDRRRGAIARWRLHEREDRTAERLHRRRARVGEA